MLCLLLCFSCIPKQTQKKETLAKGYLEKARAYEEQGDLKAALEQYKQALTVSPDNKEAKTGADRLDKQLFDLAESHYQKGLYYREQGKYRSAKNEFLMALTYRPEHEKAAQMLSQGRKPKSDTPFIYHVVKPGQSLSKIAKIYYNDYKKYHIIADFNNITDATQVTTGQRLMIPKIEGVSIDAFDKAKKAGDTEYIIHTIKPGESLSKIAKQYYGNYKLFHVIAEFNNLEDATRVHVGQKIKVPKISGVEFEDVAPEAEMAPPPPPEEIKEAIDDPEKTVAAVEDKPVEMGEPAVEIEEPAVQAEEPELEIEEPAVQTEEPAVVIEEPAVQTEEQIVDETKEKRVEPQPIEEEPPMESVAAPDESEQIEQVAGYRDMGVELYKENKFDEAVIELQKAVSADPDDEVANRYLSLSYAGISHNMNQKNDFAGARDALKTAEEFDPDCKDCAALAKEIDRRQADHLKRQAEKLIIERQYDKANSLLEETLNLFPEDEAAKELSGQSWYQKGMLQFNEKRYNDAAASFETALKFDADCEKCKVYIEKSKNIFLETHYNKGIDFFSKEDLKNAITEWEAVYDVDPDYKKVQQNLRKARLLQKRLDTIKKSKKD